MIAHTFPLDDHLVVFRPADRRLFILNSTAGWIWQAVGDGFSAAEVVKLLAGHFHIPVSSAEQDVQAVLGQWAAQGLDPAQPAEVPEIQPIPMFRPVVGGTGPAGKGQPALLHCYFGRSSFSLADYTQDLAPFFAPLLSSLCPADMEKTENRIELFKNGDEYVIVCNRVELERTPFELIAVGRVVQAIIETGYSQTTWMSFIHASAGALDGHGIVFPGIGGSGKSTLMAALARSDWTYWCDDTVPLDIQGRAGAVPLSHCLKSGSWEVLGRYYPDLEALPVYRRCDKDVRYISRGFARADFIDPLPVQALIFPVYEEGCSQSMQPLSAVEGLQRLIEAQSWISPDPAHAEKMIRWISTIPIYSLHYHSLDWAIGGLKQLVQKSEF